MKKNFLKLTVIFAICILVFSGCTGKNTGYYPSDSGFYPFSPEIQPQGPSYEYEEVKENPFFNPVEKPDSTYSLDRNTASYSFARRILNSGDIVPSGSVRIEEYINYFSYDYKKPEADEALSMEATLSDCPWNSENKLFKIGVSAEDINFENKKQNNFVFLIDVSGSMYGADRLPLVQQAFSMLVENLENDDIVSVVTYASGVGIAGEGILGKDKLNIVNIISDLQPGGSTAGAGGIELAYRVAEKYFIKGGNNRIILATDGDFNVGISSKRELVNFISKKREKGIYLSVMGVGMYNTSDTTMKALAENGNGNYGYLDSITEAKKMLVTEMGGTLVTVAKDAKINVNFKSDIVEKYRLIGYESKMMSMEDFEDENKDAGEIGAGHTVTAVYEIRLKEGKSGIFVDGEIRYKSPEDNSPKSIKREFSTELINEPVTEDTIFVGCVTEFGLLLRQSEYRGNASFNSIEQRLENLSSVTGENKDEFRSEFFELIGKAKGIYRDIYDVELPYVEV